MNEGVGNERTNPKDRDKVTLHHGQHTYGSGLHGLESAKRHAELMPLAHKGRAQTAVKSLSSYIAKPARWSSSHAVSFGFQAAVPTAAPMATRCCAPLTMKSSARTSRSLEISLCTSAASASTSATNTSPPHRPIASVERNADRNLAPTSLINSSPAARP